MCIRDSTYYDDDPVPPTDVWDDVSHLQQRDPQRTGYDTQKPLALLSRIVRCASREGELVFDPFAGSGTTLEAAAREGRRFLGVDMCPLVPNILRRRLEGAPWELLCEAEMAEDACTVEVRRGVGSVSYTHLDVYKRQSIRSMRRALRKSFAPWRMASFSPSPSGSASA